MIGAVLNSAVNDSWWIDHNEAIWGVVIGSIVTLIVGWVFWILTLTPAQLDWQHLDTYPIMRLHDVDAATLPVTVMFDGRQVVSPNVVRIRIVNTGKTPIVAADFAKPVEVVFDGAIYLSAEVTAGANRDIKQEVMTEELGSNFYSFKLDLLKPGEWFELRFLTDGSAIRPRVSARVNAQKGDMICVPRDQDGISFSLIRPGVVLVVAVYISAAFGVATGSETGRMLATVAAALFIFMLNSAIKPSIRHLQRSSPKIYEFLAFVRRAF